MKLVPYKGNAIVLAEFDDGTKEAAYFWNNIKGEGDITVVHFPEELGLPEVAIIEFAMSELNIVVELPANGQKLYMAFLEAGIEFCTEGIASCRIPQLLAEFFLPRIKQSPRSSIPILTGWKDGEYITGREFDWVKGNVTFSKLPVLKKFWPDEKASDPDFAYYIFMLKMFKDPRIRAALLTFPFLSMLASIVEEKMPMPCLNIVVEGRSKLVLAYFLQTFERYKPIIYSVAQKPKEIEKVLGSVCDETFLISADVTGFMSAYEQQRMRKNVEAVVSVLSGDEILGAPFLRKVTAGGIIFSNFAIADNRMLTIYADEKDFDSELFQVASFEEKDLPGRIFAAFPEFVKRSFADLKSGLKKGNRDCINLFQMTFDLLESFFAERKINIRNSLNLESFSFDSDLFEDSEEDVSDIFRRIMRKEIQELVTVEKRKADYADDGMVYFSDDFIWIPSNLLEKILRRNRILAERKKIFSRLKERGELITDSGYTRKIQIAKVRFEAVQIRRDFFSNEGEIDIIDLGMEGECDDR